MIESIPGVCGGRARLAGTRVPVHRVAGYYWLGYSPEEVLAVLDSLSLAQVYAALAYALANPEEIDRALREEGGGAAGLTNLKPWPKGTLTKAYRDPRVDKDYALDEIRKAQSHSEDQ